MTTLAESLARGVQHQQAGRWAEAERLFRHALKLDPRSPAALSHLATFYLGRGDLSQADQVARSWVKVQPENADARLFHGRVLRDLGRVAEAEAAFRRAVRIAPDSSRAHNNLGVTLLDQGRLPEAQESLERALAIDPQNGNAWNCLGNVSKREFRAVEAEAQYRQALAISPQLSAAWNNLGALLGDLGRHTEAISCLETATLQAPQFVEALCNLSRSLQEIGRIDDARGAAERALALNPACSPAHLDLGNCCRSLGRLDEAIRAFQSAVRLDPADPRAHSNLIYTLNFHPGYDPAAIWAEHRRWGQLHADPLTAASAPPAVDRSPDRRLRVGYVSAHFKAHAVNFFVEPILAQHDPAEVEVFCYANLPEGDATTLRLRSHVQHWREIAALSDAQVAQLVRADQIDILVDLSGHIAGNRLLVFAHKPAPVQVTYIGYQNTTGMAAMDFRLTDDWSDPPGTTEALYTEQLVRLPQTFFCYQPSTDAPPVTPLPANDRGYVTFGSFNNFAKVTPQVLAAWADILSQTPASRLVILADAVPSLVAYVAQSFAERGIAADRVEVAARRPRTEYLELMNQVDIALDPFPFQGHTTTCDALWQGLPVVTLAGQTYAQRFGSSALATLGLNELITGSTEEYVQAAATLAGDRQRLATLRGSLRQRMTDSPLLDHAGFTRRLENEYRTMWKNWCAGDKP